MDSILILDFGSQYTQLLARRIREAGVFTIVLNPLEEDKIANYLKNGFFNINEKRQDKNNLDIKGKIKGIILSGGPKSVNDKTACKVPEIVYNTDIPVLGICYGMQAIARDFKGTVGKTEVSEYGKTNITFDNKELLFDGISDNISGKDNFTVWMSHGDSVISLPENAKVIAKTENNIFAGFVLKISNKVENKVLYGLQFHPEVKHTQYGNKIIENFVFKICKALKTWKLEDFIEEKITYIKEKVRDRKAIIALSGGVDSSVAAVLAHRAIGKNLKAIFVDHGFLRLNEVEEVKSIFNDLIGIDLTVVDAGKRFLEKLKGVTDPEEKRKIIGEQFIRVFEMEAKKIKDARVLIQGTIYSDVIESAASGKATARIKSHHNVGGLPENIDFEIIEPLRDLFKDEVRKVGKILGIPDKILLRHPFPGPGLAIRIIGEITAEKLEILKKADHIFIETLKSKGWYNRVWQAFVVLTSLKSVGVVGDERSYDYVAAIRAVNSSEGMTAQWSKLPYDILEEISSRITNEVRGIGRVVYDISSKPPATIEWE